MSNTTRNNAHPARSRMGDDQHSMELFLIVGFMEDCSQVLLGNPASKQENDWGSQPKPLVLRGFYLQDSGSPSARNNCASTHFSNSIHSSNQPPNQGTRMLPRQTSTH